MHLISAWADTTVNSPAGEEMNLCDMEPACQTSILLQSCRHQCNTPSRCYGCFGYGYGAIVLCPVDELEQKSIEMLNAKDLR